ncbi:MAG: family 16 glycosylhydrolase [Oscillospiraceae bacterium]|nr:family 16 glycosylhydrolase [Oscillospiraceae bacterium]
MMRNSRKTAVMTGSVLCAALLLNSGGYYTSEISSFSSVSISAAEKIPVKSMTPTQGPELNADATGGSGFTFPVFNGDENIKFENVADDIRLYVKTDSSPEWTAIDSNAESGWVYDQNFGHFWDGPGGFWFHVTENTYVRLQSASDPEVHLDYTIKAVSSARSTYALSASGDTVIKAGETGAAGISFPKIDGGFPVQSELDSFVVEMKKDGKWISLDNQESGLQYRTAGYTHSSAATQWGYWADTVYGLWFQPVTEDLTLRFGYPEDGVKGHDCGSNYIEYIIRGNPDAYRPDPASSGPVELASADNPDIKGWNLIWSDEFESGSIDSSKWSHETGYYLSDDPGTWGWGNNELEYYTDSEKNSFVKDGKLVLRLENEPETFPQDENRTAPYSSGKIVSKDKFSFKYGRIDFCAKLPSGTGIWPALWMLPNDSRYGTWAASGEIDVMEARGRLNNTVYGTIHYGGTWPANTNTGNEYVFSDGKTYDDGYHVYSCIWEKDMIRWYADGECYSVVPNTEWYSAADRDNPYAPFDEEFYIIMNLAAGGNFDGGKVPDGSSVPSEMQVEYVRVYQAEGDSTGSFTDKSEKNDEPAVVNAQYFIKIQKYLLGMISDGSGTDYDRSGKTDIIDLVKVKQLLLGA